MSKAKLMKQVEGHIGQNDNVKFDDVIGFEDVKEFIKERLVYHYEEKDLDASIGYKAPRGMVLYGLPGVGKTMLLNAIMNELKDSKHIQFDYKSAISMRASGVGESEKNIHKMFSKLRNRDKDTVLIIDEFSSLLPKATSSTLALERIDAFLSEFDGIFEQGQRDKIFIIATTNSITKVSNAVVRSGRFDRHFEFGYPTRKESMKLFKMYILKLNNGGESIIDPKIRVNRKTIVKTMCKHFVGGDFDRLRQECLDAYKIKYRKNKDAIITLADLMEILGRHYFVSKRSM
jgi:SpoVK/Ycf46/Vps4 family AAA+-type ATPase